MIVSTLLTNSQAVSIAAGVVSGSMGGLFLSNTDLDDNPSTSHYYLKTIDDNGTVQLVSLPEVSNQESIAVNTGTTTVELQNKFIVANVSGGNVILDLPTAPTDGMDLFVILNGIAGGNTVTLNGGTLEIVDITGSPSYTFILTSDNERCHLKWHKSLNYWFIF